MIESWRVILLHLPEGQETDLPLLGSQSRRLPIPNAATGNVFQGPYSATRRCRLIPIPQTNRLIRIILGYWRKHTHPATSRRQLKSQLIRTGCRVGNHAVVLSMTVRIHPILHAMDTV